MSTLKAKIDGMVGKSFLYKTNEIKIIDYHLNTNDDIITIKTETGEIKLGFTIAKKELNEFLPLDSTPMIISNFQPSIDNSVVKDLKDILLDNINKVKDNKDYIPQATEINNNVKSIIELAKTEIQMVSTLNKLNP